MAVAFVPGFLFTFVSIINCGFGSGFEASSHYNLTSVTVEYRPVSTVPESHDLVHLVACEAVQNSAE